MKATALVVFDYSTLPVEVAEEARAVADRVRARHQRQIATIIETGRDLISIKDKLEHGLFLAWLEAEFGMTRMSANRYMQAAEHFGSKCNTVLHLPPTAVYQLAAPSTPEPVREEVIQRLEAGERVPPEEIKALVANAREEVKRVRREARLIGKAKSKSARERRERRFRKIRERDEAEFAERERLRAEATEEVATILRDHLGDDLARVVDLLERLDPRRLRDLLTGA